LFFEVHSWYWVIFFLGFFWFGQLFYGFIVDPFGACVGEKDFLNSTRLDDLEFPHELFFLSGCSLAG